MKFDFGFDVDKALRLWEQSLPLADRWLTLLEARDQPHINALASKVTQATDRLRKSSSDLSNAGL